MQLKPMHIQPVIMSAIMAGLMTGFVTWLNLGIQPDFPARWGNAFIIAWPIATATSFAAIPISVKLTGKIFAALGAK